jgi:hypothetical protein
VIINFTTFLISFISAGLQELLFPIKAKASSYQAVGADIFKYLANHGSGSVSWESKVSQG